MTLPFKAHWRSGTLYVTYTTGYTETFELPATAAATQVQMLATEHEMHRIEAAAETAVEQAAERFFEEGPESFRAMYEAEQRAEDARYGAFLHDLAAATR